VGLVPVAHIAPQIDSVLFNGKGRYELDDEALKSEITIVNVEKGKRYRLRLVQMACDTELVFNIDGHTFDIIEVEGTAVHPYTVDQFTINEGQRYSVVLNANQEVGNYWIHATPYPGRQERPYTFKGGANSALLRYKGAPEVEPPPTQQPSKAQKPFFEHELVPLEVIPAPGKPGLGNADVNLILKLGVDFNIFNFTMNGVAYHSPNVPVLLQILSGAKLAQDFFPVGSVYPLPKNKVIEVSIPGIEEGGPHPFHLHGHDMFVVRSAYSDKVNYENPIRRDVVNTGMEESNVTFRFTTNNSGPWFLHCHIDAHLADLGMAVIFAEAPEDVQEDVQPPDAWKDLCPIYNQLRPTKQRLFEHI
jgi:iron transport multicopper oxidase